MAIAKSHFPILIKATRSELEKVARGLRQGTKEQIEAARKAREPELDVVEVDNTIRNALIAIYALQKDVTNLDELVTGALDRGEISQDSAADSVGKTESARRRIGGLVRGGLGALVSPTSGRLAFTNLSLELDSGSDAPEYNFSSKSLTIRGALNISKVSTLTGNVIAKGTLTVTGAVSLASTLAVTGNTTLTGTLAVTGTTTFDGLAIIDNTATEALLVRKNSDGGDVFTVNTTTAGIKSTGTLTVTGVTTLAGNLIINANATINGVLKVVDDGPHAIGANAGSPVALLNINGNFTSDGSSVGAFGLLLNAFVIGAAGDTDILSLFSTRGGCDTQGNGDTITNLAIMDIQGDNFTDNGDTILTTSTLLISGGVSSVGANNYAINVVSGSGLSRLQAITAQGAIVGNTTIALTNATEGNTARRTLTTATETHTLSLATTSDTTSISIPAGALLIGVSFNVNTAVTDGGGDDTWSAAFITGSTATLASGATAAQNTKVDKMIVPEVSTATTQIQFTPNGGSFTGGVIEIVAYYETLTSLANV